MTAAALASGLAALSTATDAFATNSAAADVPTVSGEAGDSSVDRLEEIIVSAEKRSENVEKVPIAITVLTADALASDGVRSSTDLTSMVPNLEMYQQSTSVTPFIRGVGTKNSVVGDENAVAMYVDGVYIASAVASIFTLDDIERIEVLKGPQGTLFGRNATAGVINVVTRDPTSTPQLQTMVGYANYDTVQTSLYASDGIVPGVASDLSVYYTKQMDGWGTDLYNGQPVFMGDELLLRNKWIADLGEDTKLTAAIDFDRQVPIVAPIVRAPQGSVSSSPSPFTPPFTGANAPTPYRGFYNIDDNNDGVGVTQQSGAMVKAEHHFDWASFASITSYRNVKGEADLSDGIPTVVREIVIQQESYTGSQEFQLTSLPSSKVKWILGTYFFHDLSEAVPFSYAILGASGAFARADIYAKQTTNSYAGYGQATVPVLDRLNLTAGLRYTLDDRIINGNSFNPNTGVDVAEAKPPGEADGVQDGKVTWRFAADYQLTDYALLYGSYSRGFKSGVYNLLAPTQPAVKPETLDTYEAGMKTEFFDQRLRFDAAAFYNKFDDIQLLVGTLLGTQLLNAAKGVSQGFEMDVQAVPIRNLTISASVAHLNSEYTNFPNASFYSENPSGNGQLVTYTGDATGNQFVIAPKWTANISPRYKLPTPVGDFTFTVSGYFNDGFFFDAQNSVRQPAYRLLNANVAWNSGHFEVDLWGKNLTMTQYYANIASNIPGYYAYPAPPRTYGIQLRYKL